MGKGIKKILVQFKSLMVQYMGSNLEEIGKSWLCTTLLSFVIWLKTRVSNNPHVKPVKPRGTYYFVHKKILCFEYIQYIPIYTYLCLARIYKFIFYLLIVMYNFLKSFFFFSPFKSFSVKNYINYSVTDKFICSNMHCVRHEIHR